MNSELARLQPYPFEKLNQLISDCVPPTSLAAINLSIGEPQHAAPEWLITILQQELTEGVQRYPTTLGQEQLRQSIAHWLAQRFQLPIDSLEPHKHIIPVNGSREALFAIAQSVIQRQVPQPWVVMPNPFYQIYEGATLLAGAQPWFINYLAENDFQPDFASVPQAVWAHCQLVYVCSPHNPTGSVLNQSSWQTLLNYADTYGFVIAADECYSELYLDETQPPMGLLQACAASGRYDYKHCLVFHSLSKRSNVPGLRSGFVAGDADIIRQFLQYRTYHGCAMPLAVQIASCAAWQDETHVQANRALYRQKYAAVLDILGHELELTQPAAGFYLWPKTPIDDTLFARALFAQHHVKVLPGQFLSRFAHALNPGTQRVRIALVAQLTTCIEAAERIRTFITEMP